MWHKILGVLFGISAFLWFADAALFIFDKNFHPTIPTIILSFVITGCTVTRWSIEEFYA